MKALKHWQDAANAVLGVWLILSPWALGFHGEHAVMANMVIVGALLLAVACGAMLVPRAWEEWSEGVLGLWMIASPWVLGYAALHAARLDAVVTGIAVLLLALWTLLADKDYTGWGHKQAAH